MVLFNRLWVVGHLLLLMKRLDYQIITLLLFAKYYFEGVALYLRSFYNLWCKEPVYLVGVLWASIIVEVTMLCFSGLNRSLTNVFSFFNNITSIWNCKSHFFFFFCFCKDFIIVFQYHVHSIAVLVWTNNFMALSIALSLNCPFSLLIVLSPASRYIWYNNFLGTHVSTVSAFIKKKKFQLSQLFYVKNVWKLKIFFTVKLCAGS